MSGFFYSVMDSGVCVCVCVVHPVCCHQYSKIYLHYSSFIPSRHIQVYADTWVYSSAGEHVFARMWRPDVNPSCHASRAFTLFSREERSEHARVGSLTEQWRLHGSACLLVYGLRIESVNHHPWLLSWMLRSNSAPQAFTLSTLWTRLAPQP